MSTVRESFRNDLHRDPGDLESEADRAREHLEHTLEALERRLSPGELLDHALRAVRGNGSEFGHNLAAQVRNNPVPVVLTTVGVVWLLSAPNRPPAKSEAGGPAIRDRASGVAASARHAAGSVRDTAGDTAASARQAAHRAVEATQRAATGTAHAARQVGAATRSGADGLYRGYDYLRHEQPLVLGALAVAAGALLGALVPSTRAEDRALGDYRDRAVAEAGEVLQREAEQVERVAADDAEFAVERVREPGAMPDVNPGLP